MIDDELMAEAMTEFTEKLASLRRSDVKSLLKRCRLCLNFYGQYAKAEPGARPAPGQMPHPNYLPETTPALPELKELRFSDWVNLAERQLQLLELFDGAED